LGRSEEMKEGRKKRILQIKIKERKRRRIYKKEWDKV
jgi:hypothetical protein